MTAYYWKSCSGQVDIDVSSIWVAMYIHENAVESTGVYIKNFNEGSRVLFQIARVPPKAQDVLKAISLSSLSAEFCEEE